ncbi:transmembrane protein, putative (macronuclear) [Tetrahymena thermophila SB210]|uniref:Transmembrane protein, putative n=1 Tax=Tetrahymena thermophila (strain SB210) TaxID=312017 RepID=Q234C0_TETTS|nr:transmembrane protein, putative [Tetrahymena thermophila SB210]EAR92083.1 transmembrane protein, putative [Tetrahymena thermophila SB210]|eukprot:XP_001012328.1 transmembrane protein, putative [Tetrahymena thermophila SB210]
MWIIVALVILEKLGFFIYFYTHKQYDKWYYHIAWEIFHFDPDNIFTNEVKNGNFIPNQNHLVNINQNNNNINNVNNIQNNNNNNNINNNNNNNVNALIAQNKIINKYNLKIPLNLLVSVIFHYAILSYLQTSDQPYEKQMTYMIISLILLFTNQVLLFQRLYFRNLINLHQYLYMIAEGLAYQYTQLSLLALIQEVGNKWYVYIIAFIFAAVSLSMILERNTHLYFTESLIYLMINQVFGLRLEAEFLYSKHNDRCQKIFSYILYGFFSILFWVALLLLVLIFGSDKMYYLNYSIPIGILAACFFFLFQIMVIVRYIWKSPLQITKIVSKLEEIEQLRKAISPITKIVSLQVSFNNNDTMEYQNKLVEEITKKILFKYKDIIYHFVVFNQQKEPILNLEFLYDSQKIRIVGVRLNFENIAQLELICNEIQIQKFNYFDFVVNMQNLASIKNQAIQKLINYPLICINISKISNIIRGDESFLNYCIYMKQVFYQIKATQIHIQNLLINNPYSIYYDLYDDLRFPLIQKMGNHNNLQINI